MENEKNENINSQNDEQELENEELETPTGAENNSEDNSEDSSNSDELEELKKQNEELMNKNKQLFERLKKTNKSTKSNTSNQSGFGEEDLIRLSKVASKLDDDDLEVLKTIKGESIADKLDNPMFKAYKKDKQAQERSKASSLAPSKPGIQVQGKSFSDPSISPEDHKKMFNELMG